MARSKSWWHSSAEELLDFAQNFDKPIDVVSCIVKIKAGASGGLDTEFVHERLVAMMPAAQGDAALIGDRNQVVGMDIWEQKTYQAGPPDVRTEKSDAVFEPGQLFISMRAQFLVVLGDLIAPDSVQVIHRRVQSDRARNVRGAGLEPMRGMLPGAFLIRDAENHLATALVRGHRFKDFLPAIKHANAGRPAHLVT